jgi:signal peptidase I
MSDVSNKPAPGTRKSRVWPWIVLGIIAGLLVVGKLLVPVYKMPSGSMIPTLLLGDHVAASRAVGEPQRGDIIVFPFPENPSQLFLKRVIGLPGDKISFHDGRPILNGWSVPHCRVGRYEVELTTYELFIEWLGDHAYGVLLDAPVDGGGCKDTTDCGPGMVCHDGTCGNLQGPWVVKPGETFVIGDNRMNSHDSRSWRGGLGAGVPIATIQGAMKLVLTSSAAEGRTFFPADGPPLLPPKMASLGPALEKCLKEKPAKTSP